MGNINPLPSKQSAARAYEAFDIVTFTIGAKAANVINVAVKLQDCRGQVPIKPCAVTLYLSDNSDGHTLTATVPTSNLAIGTNGVIIGTLTTNKCIQIVSNAAGLFDLNITQTASPVPYYMVLVMPDGRILVSSVIQF
jgi:hypothetical protein